MVGCAFSWQSNLLATVLTFYTDTRPISYELVRVRREALEPLNECL